MKQISRELGLLNSIINEPCRWRQNEEGCEHLNKGCNKTVRNATVKGEAKPNRNPQDAFSFLVGVEKLLCSNALTVHSVHLPFHCTISEVMWVN